MCEESQPAQDQYDVTAFKFTSRLMTVADLALWCEELISSGDRIQIIFYAFEQNFNFLYILFGQSFILILFIIYVFIAIFFLYFYNLLTLLINSHFILQ